MSEDNKTGMDPRELLWDAILDYPVAGSPIMRLRAVARVNTLVEAMLIDAFDAGAMAMREAVHSDNSDITKLPGRPGPKKTEEGDA